MKAFAALIAAVSAVLVVPTGAIGASPDGAAGPWADGVVRFVQGPRVDGSPVTAGEQCAGGAWSGGGGARQRRPDPGGHVVSLGFGGSLTLSFENPICNRAGADFSIDIREITREPYPAEAAAVYVSADGTRSCRRARCHGTRQWRSPPSSRSPGSSPSSTCRTPRVPARVDADGFDVDGLERSTCRAVSPQARRTSCRPRPPGREYRDTTTVPLTVKCSPAYWTSPLTLRVWPIGRTRQFNAVFGVKAFPRTTLLQAATRRGGGKVALAREAVYSLLRR